MKITEQDREVARNEIASQKMSEKVADRLRQITEQERADKEANKRFAAAFATCPHDCWTLAQIIGRISSDHTQLERKANKLRAGLRKGWTVTSTQSAVLLSELTLEECQMSDEQFVASLDGQHRAETYHGTRYLRGSAEPLFDSRQLPLTVCKTVRKPRVGGRPKRWQSNAERMRAYRRKVAA